MATFHIWSDSLTKWQMDKSDYLTPLCACADRVKFIYQGPNKFHENIVLQWRFQV